MCIQCVQRGMIHTACGGLLAANGLILRAVPSVKNGVQVSTEQLSRRRRKSDMIMGHTAARMMDQVCNSASSRKATSPEWYQVGL